MLVRFSSSTGELEMGILTTELKNCYGIKSLDAEFDFTKEQRKAFAIYAPNGLMKTSFTRTFEALSRGEQPKEERFERFSIANVTFKGVDIKKEKVYVLKSEIDIKSETDSVTNLLINQESKSKYDAIISELNSSKTKLITQLQKISKVRKDDIDSTLTKDLSEKDFLSSVGSALKINVTDDLSKFTYNNIFESKALEVLDSREFILKAKEFAERYNELFEECGAFYKKGIFNPTKANKTSESLEKNSFFEAGHMVKIDGEKEPIGLEDYKSKIIEIGKKIDSDAQLSKLKTSLEKNAQAQYIQSLLESSSPSEAELFITKVNPGRRDLFKKELWSFYLTQCEETSNFLAISDKYKDELLELEKQAEKEAPLWADAIDLFNSRFVDMPFKLSLYNKSDVTLGKANAILKFIFKEDGEEPKDFKREQIKALSQGEQRALYLLNFIFDVELKIKNKEETLFIIDDIADSFDYKNKSAILQYLIDLTRVDFFYQIIFTHNFDFFRSLANDVAPRRNCLMANKLEGSIELVDAKAINDIFQNDWKKNIERTNSILYSCIPFTRNIVEYLKPKNSKEYLLLTSLLHWKIDTTSITRGKFLDTYNSVFNENYKVDSDALMYDILLKTADEISGQKELKGLDLQDKVLLSIAIRVLAEKYMTNKLRGFKKDPNYWFEKSTYGKMLGEFESYVDSKDEDLKTLRKVGVTVNSNIHLNSFMYEPILDLSLTHLSELYKEIKAL